MSLHFWRLQINGRIAQQCEQILDWKVTQISPNVAPNKKKATMALLKKFHLHKIAQKSLKFWPTFFTKNFHQDVSKIAQSGHTAAQCSSSSSDVEKMYSEIWKNRFEV